MKTMNFFVAIIATFVMTVSASANTASKKNASEMTANTTEMVSQAKQKVVYKGDSKIVYNTDAQGRVISKMILHKGNDCWVPVGVYTVGYGENVNTVTYAHWNETNHTFTRDAKQTNYDAKQFPVVIAMPE